MTFHIYIYIYIYIYFNEAVVQKPLFHSSEHKLQKQHFNTLTAETPQMMITLTHLVLVNVLFF